MWTIYDEMIDGIPKDIVVEDVLSGIFGTLVKTDLGSGFSLSFSEPSRPHSGKKQRGMKLRELAGFIKSWNFTEASLGQAAINAYYNTPAIAAQNGISLPSGKTMAEDRLSDPFITYQNQIRGTNVAVMGRFPYIEQLFAPVCNMSVIETEPSDGGYPDDAAEFILPECEFVFLSGRSVLYKSLGRYLKLCGQAKKIILVGPSTPLAPSLFQHGISDLSGLIIYNHETAVESCCGLTHPKISRSSYKVSLKVPVE